MAGEIRQIIDEIIGKLAKENETLNKLIQAKMLLLGVNPNNYTRQSADDPLIIAKLENLKKQINLHSD